MDRINNNIKFYTFIEILRNYSDSEVSLSIKEINHHMKSKLGITLDRRTIYAYIKDMKALGFDVSDYDKYKEGYYLNSHSLEDYEVKILSDAVLTSNFITRKKTLDLIDKLKSFNSVYKRTNDFLDRIIIEEIPKSNNEEIYSNMRLIDSAIHDLKKISFNYCNYDCNKNLICRSDSNGENRVYINSPVYLILRRKNYYLVGADENSRILKNYRVDRMKNIQKMDDDIMDLSSFWECRNGFNPGEYVRTTFKMFGGETSIVVVNFDKSLLNYLLDELGDYICIMKKADLNNNNLGYDIKMDILSYQILEKILGKREYNEYILSGSYVEHNHLKNMICDFIKNIREIIKKDSESNKYIGIFVAKNGPGIAKWILQCGSDIEVVYPQSLRDSIKIEINKMKKFYLD